MGEIERKLSEFVAATQFNDVPVELMNDTKRALLDSIGCAVAAMAVERGRISAELAKRLGGPAESTVIGSGDKVSCANAAYANAEAINAMDFDPMCASHSLPVIVAAALAVAESTGASGKDLLLAIAIGHEVVTRLYSAQPPMLKAVSEGGQARLSWGYVQGFATTTPTAAACAGKLMKLNPSKIASALGTAAFLCMPNTLRKFAETSPARMSKYGMFGWGAQGGVTAALLAEMGFEGDTDAFEGDYGLYRYSGFQQWNTNKILEDLGTKWKHSIKFKQYPCRYPGAGALDNFINIIEKNKLQPGDIESVRGLVEPFTTAYKVVRENTLATPEDFSFNIPYCISCAAFRINPARWLDSETRQDPRIREFMKKVEIHCDEREFAEGMVDRAAKPHYLEAEVVANGKTLKSQTLHRRGEPFPGFRTTDEEAIAKFTNNVSRVLAGDKISQIARAALDIDQLDRVGELTKLLARN
jgi:2-methylcitrate dehydratase PrpD